MFDANGDSLQQLRFILIEVFDFDFSILQVPKTHQVLNSLTTTQYHHVPEALFTPPYRTHSPNLQLLLVY